MKNLTTVAAAIGIDLGDEYSHYVCIDDNGEKFESGEVRMTPSSFLRIFSSWEPTRIAIEAGAQSR